MTSDEFLKLRDELEESARAALVEKGKEYTRSGDDKLSNFKKRAEEAGVTVRQAWSLYAGKHWDSIMNWAKGGDFGSEPAIQRFGDLRNYLELGFAIYVEEIVINSGAKPSD